MSTEIQKSSAESAFELAQREALALTRSALVPKIYQGKDGLANALIAMNLAKRMGADPLMVMQNLHVVQGRPGFGSSFLIASVNSCGKFSPLRFEFKGEAGNDDYACRAYAIEKETGDRLDGSWITWKMAKAEGWISKSGSKWQTMPEQMMRYRAASFWQRVYAPEISMGLLSTEELADVGPVNARATSTDVKAIEDALLGGDADDATPPDAPEAIDDGEIV